MPPRKPLGTLAPPGNLDESQVVGSLVQYKCGKGDTGVVQAVDGSRWLVRFKTSGLEQWINKEELPKMDLTNSRSTRSGASATPASAPSVPVEQPPRFSTQKGRRKSTNPATAATVLEEEEEDVEEEANSQEQPDPSVCGADFLPGSLVEVVSSTMKSLSGEEYMGKIGEVKSICARTKSGFLPVTIFGKTVNLPISCLKKIMAVKAVQKRRRSVGSAALPVLTAERIDAASTPPPPSHLSPFKKSAIAGRQSLHFAPSVADETDASILPLRSLPRANLLSFGPSSPLSPHPVAAASPEKSDPPITPHAREPIPKFGPDSAGEGPVDTANAEDRISHVDPATRGISPDTNAGRARALTLDAVEDTLDLEKEEVIVFKGLDYYDAILLADKIKLKEEQNKASASDSAATAPTQEMVSRDGVSLSRSVVDRLLSYVANDGLEDVLQCLAEGREKSARRHDKGADAEMRIDTLIKAEYLTEEIGKAQMKWERGIQTEIKEWELFLERIETTHTVIVNTLAILKSGSKKTLEEPLGSELSDERFDMSLVNPNNCCFDGETAAGV